jgi:hypothetical protein
MTTGKSMRTATACLCTLLVAACGGGTTSTEPAANPAVNAATGVGANTLGSTPVPPSAPGDGPVRKTVVIPDPTAWYEDECEARVMQFVIPVTLNDDGQQDFIVHSWCSLPQPWGRTVSTPTPDSLVAHVSQPDGSYRVANEQVFGSRFARLGGASGKYVRGDINGDGRDDFAFAMSWEDGRLAVDPITNSTESSVLLSTPDGGYRVRRLGRPNWNHAVEIVRNAGSVDVVFAGFHGGLQAFRYRNGDFAEVTAEYASDPISANWAATFSSIPDPSTGLTRWIGGAASRVANGPGGNGLAEFGIQLWGRRSASWSIEREFWQGTDFTVNWIGYNASPFVMSVATIDGRQYFGGAHDGSCAMPPLRPGGSPLLVAKVGAVRDKRGRMPEPGQTYTESVDTWPVNIMRFFEIDASGAFQPIPSPIVDEEIFSVIGRFDCKDINGDGLPDLVSYAVSSAHDRERVAEAGKPTVYLNDAKGRLVRLDIGHLPGSTATGATHSFLSDVDGDGVIDLLLSGTTTTWGGGAIEIHLLRAPLRLP